MATITPTPTITSTAKPVTATPVPTTSPTQGWLTYNNNTYKFSFQYPTDYTEGSPSGFPSQYFLPTLVTAYSTTNSQYQVAVHYSQEDAIVVSESSNTGNCYLDPQANTQMTNSLVVNGQTFKYSQATNNAAGHQSVSTVYRTVTGSTCFEITLTVQSESDGTNVDSASITNSQTAAKSELSQILSTFKFTS